MNVIKTENALEATKQSEGKSNQDKHDSSTQPKSPLSPANWATEFELTDAEVKEISSPEWIYDNLIISSHIVTIPAEPNGGKTTIMLHVAKEMVKEGYDVFYVNVDTSGGDAKPMVEYAKESGFKLMLPDMKHGKSIVDLSNKLVEMIESESRFEKTVFIFDTLKKFADVISKRNAKQVYSGFRKLTAKGVTIILLAHTNKYTDNDGKPIYEGTGDIRSDTDELIYLIPQKHDDGSMTVTTDPNKVRGSFQPITFHIDCDRRVTQLDDLVDTVAANKIDNAKANDQVAIDLISDAIRSGSTTQKAIIAYCKDHNGPGQRKAKALLEEYSRGPGESLFDNKFIWIVESGDRNSYIYSLIN